MSIQDWRNLADEIHAQEFGSVWSIRDGHVVNAPGSAPSVHIEELTDGGMWSEPFVDSENWEPMTRNMSAQYGYSGPIMHPSETVGWGIAERLAEQVGDFDAFAIELVECLALDGWEDAPAGWLIVGRRKVSEGVVD